MSDIRTPEENAQAADAITAIVAKLTSDEQSSLHVSIAGGRKTMGFYLGYAFSLFARPQDRLSHVLVSSPFESHPDFFYPPRKTRRLTTKDNKYIDTADAVVTLADIPVVRLRHGLPNALLENTLTFNQTVAEIQKGFSPPRLAINLKTLTIFCGDECVVLQPLLFAWFTWWAVNVLKDTPMLNWREIDSDLFLQIYAFVVDKNSETYLKLTKRLIIDGDEMSFYQENNSKLNRAIIKQLKNASSPYLLNQFGKRGSTKRGLSLNKEQIFIEGIEGLIGIRNGLSTQIFH